MIRRHLARRGLLAGTAGVVATTAGCGSIVDEWTSTTETVESFERSTDYMLPGEWWVERFELERPGRLTYEFSAGGKVDVYLLPGDAYVQYRDAARSDANAGSADFDYHRAGSVLDETSGETSVELRSGGYALVLDNTRIGPAAVDPVPDDDQVRTLSNPRLSGEATQNSD